MSEDIGYFPDFDPFYEQAEFEHISDAEVDSWIDVWNDTNPFLAHGWVYAADSHYHWGQRVQIDWRRFHVSTASGQPEIESTHFFSAIYRNEDLPRSWYEPGEYVPGYTQSGEQGSGPTPSHSPPPFEEG